ncbi:MAG: YdbH domain-containing protein [Aliidiomarina sp.]|uniref:YdbH domain-containing protein n=1 Tax=Aliidiomarina sp. TaxID=1872439 RepID=UPI0025BF7134|nr:YdbH domain-containing protein [Aliidiomarina sp.]MCH8500494.1 YdbH domain-containing protein [Aliidiomarina sp.]
MTTAKTTPHTGITLRYRLLRGFGWLTAAVCAFLLATFLLASLFVHQLIQEQFRTLGITDASWTVTALSHQQVRLNDIQFRYRLNNDDAKDDPKDENTLAVHIHSLRLNFHWQGATWRSLPVLEQMSMSGVEVTLNQLPHQILAQLPPSTRVGSDATEPQEPPTLQQALSLERIAHELSTFHWLAEQWQIDLEDLTLAFPCTDVNDEICTLNAQINANYHHAQQASLAVMLAPNDLVNPQSQLRLAIKLDEQNKTIAIDWRQPELFNAPFTVALQSDSIEFAGQLRLELKDWLADLHASPSRQPLLQVLERWHLAAFSPTALESLQGRISDMQAQLAQQLIAQLPLQPLQTAILSSQLNTEFSGRLPWPTIVAENDAQLHVDSQLRMPLGPNSLLQSTLALTHESALINLVLEAEPETLHALRDTISQQRPDHADMLLSLQTTTPLQLQLRAASEFDFIAFIHSLVTDTSGDDVAALFTQAFLDVQLELNDFPFQHQEFGASRVRGQTQLRLPLVQLLDNEAELNIALPAPTEFNIDLERWTIDDETQLQHVQLSSQVRQFQLDRSAPLKSQMSANVAVKIREITHPSLLPQAWSGNLAIQPQLDQAGTHHLVGDIENQAGLLARYSTLLALDEMLREPAATFAFDWQLEDIFLIAGNPLAHTLVDWPELLTLERGRIQAQGQLSYASSAPDSPLQITATLRLGDLVGIYDVSAFRGLNAEFDATMNAEQLVVSTEQLRLLSLQQGFLIGPIEAGFRYQADVADPLTGKLELHHNQVQLFDGRVNLRNQVYDFSAEQLLLPVEFDALNLAALLTQYPVSDFTGSGLLSGVIPIRLGKTGIFVDNGTIQALPPGGQLRYSSEALAGYAASNVSMRTLMSVLENFHYDLLSGAINYYDDGTLELQLSLQGQNQELENGRPVRLNLVVQENLPALLTSLQLTNQVNKVIEERLQQRLLRQR